MTRPAPTRRRPATAPPVLVGPDLTAALARLRAGFGPVKVLSVRAHAPDPGQAPEAGPVQCRLPAQEAIG
jgi:hypothetical protein